MPLLSKALTGVVWTSIGRAVVLMIEFVIGIVLARLLTPGEFGILGLLSVLFVLSEIVINSGFSQALIRNPNNTHEDYATAFLFNLGIGLLLFVSFYFTAPYLADYLEVPDTVDIIRVMSVGQVISAFTLVQRSILTIEMNFKSLSKYSMVATLISGITAVTMALLGFGIWSLVAKTLLRDLINSLLIWINTKWKPDLKFSIKSFKSLYGYGVRLLLSGIFGAIANNIVSIVIGKNFSVSDVGFYTRAELFKNLPSQNVESIITSVGYPALAKIQHDKVQFKLGVQMLFINTAFIVFPLMFLLAGIAEPLLILLLGEKWLYSAQLLQYMCPIGIIYPLWTINLNVLGIVGRSDLYLRVQLIYQTLTIISVIGAVMFSIEVLILFLIIANISAYFLYSFHASRFSDYGTKAQLKDIFPLIVSNTIMLFGVWVVGIIFKGSNNLAIVVLQSISGIAIFIATNEMLKISSYLFFRQLILKRFHIAK